MQAVHNRHAPLINCWGFVDGTARLIGRSSVEQSEYFSGHKRTHLVKYQAVMGANGIVCELDGSYLGRDTTLVNGGILGENGLYCKLQCLTCGQTSMFLRLRPPLLEEYLVPRLN
ncbi:hypothetical protein MRX96_017803 [Rhipicephalus microplus]